MTSSILFSKRAYSFFVICLLCAMSSIFSAAQTLTTLVKLDGADGAQPEYMTLAQGRDGNLWGTTQAGGSLNLGTAFRMTPEGVMSTISFDVTRGAIPFAGMVLGPDNNFYGVTDQGGSGQGVVFKLSSTGSLTGLLDLDGTAGIGPAGALTLGADGNFYGTTYFGGTSSNCFDGCGTVFKITPGGTLSTLYNFDGAIHGASPWAGLVQGSDGNFYGTTSAGGSNTICSSSRLAGCGTVFRITPSGNLTVIHRFSSSDGASPHAGLVQGTDGNFYGTTLNGGSGSSGTVFRIATQTGVLTTLYNFTGGKDGSYPIAPLVEGTDGNFYGATADGGNFHSCTNGCGTLYQITANGVLTTLYVFGGDDGVLPTGGLMQHTNGLFYGSTQNGGAGGVTGVNGTIFSLNMGLGSFIKAVVNYGVPGSSAQILGTGLTGATAVTFNGTPVTSFSVVSDSYMTATVPAGATTGLIQVTTPGGTLTSNVNFIVGR